jgi:hypothetical protein
MHAEEGRRLVIREQASTVKRAMAAANDMAQRDLRRRRGCLLLVFLLLFSAWRLLQPAPAALIPQEHGAGGLSPRRTVAFDSHGLNSSENTRANVTGAQHSTAAVAAR